MTDDSEAIGGVKQNLDYNAQYTLKDPDHDEIKDGYQIRWVGKSYAKLQENLRPETVIVPDFEHNQKPENKNSKNLFLTGDNLEVLKHLEYAYTGKIDVIYIDPPYNTGGDGFVYDDNFRFSDEQLRDTLGLSEDEVKRIRNIYGKASHSAWLTFMYPRLKIAKSLLKQTGVIFVSIDENEQANLRLLMDEVFATKVETMVWRKSGNGRDGKMKNTATFRNDHEYIMVAYRYVQSLNKSFEKPNWQNEYNNPDNDPRGTYKAGSISVKEEASKQNSPNYYTVISPIGKKFTRQFELSQEEFNRLNDDGRIYWGKNGDAVPSIKIFTDEERAVTTSSIIDYQDMTTTTGSKELDRLLNIEGIGDEVRPKPTALIKKLIQIGSSEDALILDFFAGSATTAHAVMSLNKSVGNRKYIMCTLDEHVKDGTIAGKNGYNTIDQIARDRIVKAANRIGDTSGFRHYRFKSPGEQTLERVEEFDPTMQTLVADDMIQPFSEKALVGKGADDGVATILTTWLIDDGYTFDTKAEELNLAGYTANYAPDIARLYLIDNDGWSKESCKQLLNMLGKNEVAVNAIVIYAYSFDFISLTELKNNLKANIDKNIQIIERY